MVFANKMSNNFHARNSAVIDGGVRDSCRFTLSDGSVYIGGSSSLGMVVEKECLVIKAS